MLEDDETYAPGDEATVDVALERGGTVHDSATRTATVTGRDQRCTGEG